MSSHSTQLWSQAQTFIPGGVNSPVRAFRSVGGSPLFFQRGQGPYLFDVDNKQYVDYVGSWGPLILGHAYPTVVEAVLTQAKLGLSFGAPTPLEVEMAMLLCRLVPSLEQVRLVNSGTEASMSAIRIARGITKRNKILKFDGCYHGHADSLLVKAGSGVLTFGLPDSPGVPQHLAALTISLPFNDLQATEAAFKKYGSDIAAVIVEPIAGNMNCVLPTPTFLPGLRALCTQYGALLIFDEVITGFRVALNGAQSLYQVKPDITCLGKIIGGGLPVGAFGGSRELMSNIAPLGPIYQAGTLSGNPIAVAAGLATLKELMKPTVYEKLGKTSAFLCEELKKTADRYGIPFQTTSLGGMFGLFFTEETDISNYEQVSKSDVSRYKQFFHGMLEQGVYLAPSAFEIGCISTAHTSVELDKTFEAASEVFKKWKI